MKNPDFSVLRVEALPFVDKTITKITAIRICRATFSLGLKQAKDIVDSSFVERDISIEEFCKFMNKCFEHLR